MPRPPQPMKPIFSFRLSGLPKVTEGKAIVLAATAAVPLALIKVRRLVECLSFMRAESLDGWRRFGNSEFFGVLCTEAL